jgi:hypothetical protein
MSAQVPYRRQRKNRRAKEKVSFVLMTSFHDADELFVIQNCDQTRSFSKVAAGVSDSAGGYRLDPKGSLVSLQSNHGATMVEVLAVAECFLIWQAGKFLTRGLPKCYTSSIRSSPEF